ncbi:MAG: CHC2 zinc finger domain-containing protein [Bacteroidales bacterium]
MLSKSDIERIKQLDLRIVIERYRPGTKFVNKGRELACCCPFHNEKTPSFSIQKVAGKSQTGLPIWKCYGG